LDVAGNEETPKDILVSVAELQNLKGFWKLEAKLAALLDCQLDKLISSKPKKPTELEDAVWATALVVAFLKTKFADRRLEWQLMAKKAQAWLAGRLTAESSVDEVINEAAAVLVATSGPMKQKK
uniref:von Willebrand factor A domain-containing protein 5A n=1 Tax=Schistocephalus solidus TaxID=70667 RepID=A0A183SAR1_SCHSO